MTFRLKQRDAFDVWIVGSGSNSVSTAVPPV